MKVLIEMQLEDLFGDTERSVLADAVDILNGLGNWPDHIKLTCGQTEIVVKYVDGQLEESE